MIFPILITSHNNIIRSGSMKTQDRQVFTYRFEFFLRLVLIVSCAYFDPMECLSLIQIYFLVCFLPVGIMRKKFWFKINLKFEQNMLENRKYV